jgi:hypothetical protein
MRQATENAQASGSTIRTFLYLSNFGAVCCATLVAHGAWLAYLAGASIPYQRLFLYAAALSTPIPFSIRGWVPAWMQVGAPFVLWALLLRRVWLLYRDRSLSPPTSFSGLLYALAFVPAVSLWLGLLEAVVDGVLAWPRGELAEFVWFPALLLLPLTVLLVEAFSLWTSTGRVLLAKSVTKRGI